MIGMLQVTEQERLIAELRRRFEAGNKALDRNVTLPRHAGAVRRGARAIRVRALLGARAITGAGSTWSPRNNGYGLYLEPVQ